jgi:hypothetical protein
MSAEAENIVIGGSVNRPLPQPTETTEEPHRYLCFEQIEPQFFPGPFQTQQLCWVLLSKGKCKTPQLSSRARIVSESENDSDRFLVQYPKGSTYNVRRSNLIPVLEHEERLILVASETNDYRRMSCVHTLATDHFLEIGCDFGITVNMVDAKSKLGVDKSETSIAGAKKRYPDCDFLLGDIFEGLNLSLQQPLVVAMDINGNRELPAVLQGIQVVLDKWSPRLLMVKSRELHALLSNTTSKTT